MKSIWFLVLLTGTFAADIVDPSECAAFPCLIFNDEFDFLDHTAWEHEITMAGGGNWQFQVYINNRSVSYTRDSTLFIKPNLVSEWKDEEFLSSGELDIWGNVGRNDLCTGNKYSGCRRTGSENNIINPIMSASLRTLQDFSFKYGRIEIRAKMPRGAWLWPAMWMLPRNLPYGFWPASGEIDIAECRGNDDYGNLGNQYGLSTLHWGPFWPLDRYNLTQSQYAANDGSFANSFHVWRLDWTKDKLEVYVDDLLVMTADPGSNFWNFGGFSEDLDNIWNGGEKLAPFDQKFYIILNLAVGGTDGFFSDEIPSNPPKPWLNSSPTASLDFWNGRDSWLPTWKQGEEKISENAALQVDYVKVWKLESIEQ